MNMSDVMVDWAFNECSSLERIDLTPYILSVRRGINSMFSGCSSLISANISSLIPAGNTGTSNNAFNGCYSLQNIYTLPPTTYEDRIGVDNMFKDCYSLSLESLSSIIHFLLSSNAQRFDSLKDVGLNVHQACLLLKHPNWSTLAGRGWTSGYENDTELIEEGTTPSEYMDRVQWGFSVVLIDPVDVQHNYPVPYSNNSVISGFKPTYGVFNPNLEFESLNYANFFDGIKKVKFISGYNNIYFVPDRYGVVEKDAYTIVDYLDTTDSVSTVYDVTRLKEYIPDDRTKWVVPSVSEVLYNDQENNFYLDSSLYVIIDPLVNRLLVNEYKYTIWVDYQSQTPLPNILDTDEYAESVNIKDRNIVKNGAVYSYVGLSNLSEVDNLMIKSVVYRKEEDITLKNKYYREFIVDPFAESDDGVLVYKEEVLRLHGQGDPTAYDTTENTRVHNMAQEHFNKIHPNMKNMLGGDIQISTVADKFGNRLHFANRFLANIRNTPILPSYEDNVDRYGELNERDTFSVTFISPVIVEPIRSDYIDLSLAMNTQVLKRTDFNDVYLKHYIDKTVKDMVEAIYARADRVPNLKNIEYVGYVVKDVGFKDSNIDGIRDKVVVLKFKPKIDNRLVGEWRAENVVSYIVDSLIFNDDGSGQALIAGRLYNFFYYIYSYSEIDMLKIDYESSSMSDRVFTMDIDDSEEPFGLTLLEEVQGEGTENFFIKVG